MFFFCGGGFGLFFGILFIFELMIGWRIWGNLVVGRCCLFERFCKLKKVNIL